MKNILKRLLSALLTLCTVFSVLGIPVFAAADGANADAADAADATDAKEEETEITAETYLKKYTYSSATEKLATMELIFDASETFGYRLYALELTGEVAVEDVRTGQILFTNPYDAGSASKSPDTLNKLFSQVFVNYTDNANKTTSLYSYNDAAMLEQISLNRIKNGIRMDYTVGRSDTRRLCPLSIEKGRYEEVLLAYIEDANDYKKFKSYYTLYDPFTEESEAVKQSWLETYPITAEMAIYVMAESSTNYEKNKVESIIRAWCPHYTYEDLQADHEQTKFVASTEVMPVFKMSLEYKLDEKGLTVRLPANSISFNEDYYTLNSITILPYFGAGSSDYTGYTFVPDGSGTLIRFEDIKDTTYLFTGELYGPDYSYQTLSTSFTGKAEIMRLPVFGLVEDRAYFYKLDEDGNKTDEIYCAHNNMEEVETVEHTCTEDGYTLYECVACGEQVKDKIVPAAHTYTAETTVVTKPTCTAQGYTTYTCTVCGEVNVSDYTEPAHAYESVVTPSGCSGTERGYTTYTCSVCGDSYVGNYTDPTHDYKEITVEGVTKKADCKTGDNGHAVFECSKCGDRYETDTYAQHDLRNAKETSETIKIQSKTYKYWTLTCSVCKAEFKIIDHNGTENLGSEPNFRHSITNASKVVVSEAGCHSYGVVKGICRVCGEDYGEVTEITEPSHKFEDIVTPATCTEQGYTDRTCSECGYYVRMNYTDPAHSFEETVVEPTCTTNGYTVKTCTVCGYTETGSYTSAGHNWNYGVTDINGKTVYTCLTCFATTSNAAYVKASGKRGDKLTEDAPVPKEEDFAGVEPPAEDLTSEDITSADVTSEDVASEAAASEDVTSENTTSGDVASGDATSDLTSEGTGKVESDLTVPDGAYVKYISRGYFAIVEEGDSLSTITSDHGGALHKYNSVYISVNPRPSDQYNLADSLSVGSDAPWTVVSKRKYTGSYTLRIVMLGEGTDYEASYNGMANAYRDYLKENGTLTPLTADERGIPLTMSTFGWSGKQESFLGIPIWVDQPVTSFEDMKIITSELREVGITNLNFELYGWTENGDLPDKLEYNKVLGGDEGYKDFAKFAEENDLGLFPEFSFGYGWSTRWFGGISLSKHGAKTIDDRYIIKREYDPVLQILARGFGSSSGRVMSASAFEYFYSLIFDDLTEFGYLGIAPRDLGSDLNSDFDEDEPYNREDSKGFVIDVLQTMKEDSGDNVMVDGGNAYTFPYVRYILNMPLEGSNYLNTSASVPFMGMVLHGYIGYTGDPTNDASDSRKETLKMIENGAYPFFRLGYENTQLLVGSNYYAISYSSWKDDMIEIYNTVNTALKDLQTTEFVEHNILIGERVPDADELERDKVTSAEALAKAEEDLEAAKTAYINAIDVYNRLIDERKVDYAARLYPNIATTKKAYDNAIAAKKTADATYGERTSDYDEAGNYITTRYTVTDNSIVQVTYANGTSYILNYNDFAVTVNVYGQSYTIPAFDYVAA